MVKNKDLYIFTNLLFVMIETKRILVTGGAGFIGSNFIKYILKKRPGYIIYNLDKLTYAGNLDNFNDVKDDEEFRRYTFKKGDICDRNLVRDLVHISDIIVNFAAESHVDKSLLSPEDFIKTNVIGTWKLLEAAREEKIEKFIQISTDEVYGSILKGSFSENSSLNPSSPYALSKATADLLALRYFKDHNLPVIIPRSTNNYGPNQYPEKVIPLFVTNALEDKELPLYGDGMNVRDWLYVEDNCEAIDLLIHEGKAGEIYNIGTNKEITNKELTYKILEYLNKPETLIKHVTDRLGHDRRYSILPYKIGNLGWSPKTNFNDGLKKTIDWYVNNKEWWGKIKSGEFKEYYKKQYGLK